MYFFCPCLSFSCQSLPSPIWAVLWTTPAPWGLQEASLAVAVSPLYSQQGPVKFQDPLLTLKFLTLTAECRGNHLFRSAWPFSFEVGVGVGWEWGWLPALLISGLPYYCLFSF